MHIWTIAKWRKYYLVPPARKGLRLKFDKEVNPEVRKACKEFAKWLRGKYYFPIRVPLYLKASKRIKSLDGDFVVGTFFCPDYCYDEPYGRIATGDYQELIEERGQYNAIAEILLSMAHELTHYYQWVNRLELTLNGEERQAKRYAYLILDEYAQTRENF